MNRRLLLIAGLSLLAGCATQAAGPASPAQAPAPEPKPGPGPGPGPQELEPLYAVSADPVGLTLRVASNGCTHKEDFAFYVERRLGQTTIAFGRRRVDICRSFAPAQAEMTFTYAELGVEPNRPLFVLNPVQASPK
ncbi:hypothetical protein C5708_07930 [Caulobacter sp. CCUG 60055]|uniref:hypothetical protein n=1 Tax=Caulobacter sp. CCUG 60055 TaxID=2100090 RepID=UPI001FA6B9B7|nr:hypothetical protein [Caulobacter sp. CCUG 60055]MCI3180179.1 hypothetical protein [Caulobacter sp. CCUG 60055]